MPVIFRGRRLFHSRNASLSTGPVSGEAMPALLISASSRPKRPSVRSMHPRTERSLATSQRTKSKPVAAAASRPASTSASAISTSEPRAASSSAVARPMPCAPPVTTAAFREYSRAKPRRYSRASTWEDRAMQVKEILRVKGNRLVSIEPAGRAADAVKTMAKENLGSLVVMDGGRMAGMLTFRELLLAVAQRSGSLGEVRVADIMVRDPVSATPEMEVNDLRRTMLESGARYLPVMQDGRLIGVISFRDVAKAVLEEQDFENKMLKGYIKNWPA